MKKSFWLIVILAASLLFCSCTVSKNWVVLPETPYPYDTHRAYKTTTYYIYHQHFQSR